VPVGAGTDATRVASYNPFVSLHWLVAGKTVGGTALYPEANRLDRMEALRRYTVGSAWFAGTKGPVETGKLADLELLLVGLGDEEALSPKLMEAVGRVSLRDRTYSGVPDRSAQGETSWASLSQGLTCICKGSPDPHSSHDRLLGRLFSLLRRNAPSASIGVYR
jgi:hypothetical protein